MKTQKDQLIKKLHSIGLYVFVNILYPAIKIILILILKKYVGYILNTPNEQNQKSLRRPD